MPTVHPSAGGQKKLRSPCPQKDPVNTSPIDSQSMKKTPPVKDARKLTSSGVSHATRAKANWNTRGRFSFPRPKPARLQRRILSRFITFFLFFSRRPNALLFVPFALPANASRFPFRDYWQSRPRTCSSRGPYSTQEWFYNYLKYKSFYTVW